MGFKTGIKPEDALFSEMVRELANWRCVRCKRQHEPKQNTMDCSHYFGRSKGNVRFDLDNADALCRYPCHQGPDSTDSSKFGWEYQKAIKDHKNWSEDGAYTAYKKQQLGEKGFNELLMRSEQSCKRMTGFEVKLYRKLLRKELEDIKRKKEGFIFGKH